MNWKLQNSMESTLLNIKRQIDDGGMLQTMELYKWLKRLQWLMMTMYTVYVDYLHVREYEQFIVIP